MKRQKKLLFLFLATCLLTSLFFLPSRPPKYYLSVVALFRNEARFLKEWIEYNRMIGVEHFYLYNHLSKDDYITVLQPYIDEGIVELSHIFTEGSDVNQWNKIQCQIYQDCIRNKEKETFWLAIIDTDEFIVPLTTHNLQKFLVPYEPYGGLAINWQIYGTSSVKKIDSNRTLIESLTRKSPQDTHQNLFIKSIVQPKRVKKISQPHYCKYKEPYFHVTEKKEPFNPKSSLTDTVSIDTIRINHYTCRDEEFFYTEKVRRLKQWDHTVAEPSIDHSRNSEEDLTIAPFIPELRSRLFTGISK